MNIEEIVKNIIFVENGLIVEYYSRFNPIIDGFSNETIDRIINIKNRKDRIIKENKERDRIDSGIHSIHSNGIASDFSFNGKKIISPSNYKDKNIINYITNEVLEKLYEEKAILKGMKNEKYLIHDLFHFYFMQTEVILTGTFTETKRSNGYIDTPDDSKRYTIITPNSIKHMKQKYELNKKIIKHYEEYCKISGNDSMRIQYDVFRELSGLGKSKWGNMASFGTDGNIKIEKCFTISSLIECVPNKNYLITYNLEIRKIIEKLNTTINESFHTWRLYKFRTI